MKDYRPSTEVLNACGFKRSPEPGEWCHMNGVHMHYLENDHVMEVYVSIPHLALTLTSQNDGAFRTEVQELEAASSTETRPRRRD